MKNIKNLLRIFDRKYRKTEEIFQKIQKFFRKFRKSFRKFRKIQENQQLFCF